jgi:hypothetical protein
MSNKLQLVEKLRQISRIRIASDKSGRALSLSRFFSEPAIVIATSAIWTKQATNH